MLELADAVAEKVRSGSRHREHSRDDAVDAEIDFPAVCDDDDSGGQETGGLEDLVLAAGRRVPDPLTSPAVGPEITTPELLDGRIWRRRVAQAALRKFGAQSVGTEGGSVYLNSRPARREHRA